jgi:c-di-GMP-binding flagellar brake protein YcgR
MQPGPERRRHPRIKAKIPLELHCSGQPPMRTSTEEISICGCYIETMFTIDVGTKLELVFSLQSSTLILQGVVTTKYPQVGNGIEFLDVAPEARQRLADFLATL